MDGSKKTDDYVRKQLRIDCEKEELNYVCIKLNDLWI